jgi:hypothetical protein
MALGLGAPNGYVCPLPFDDYGTFLGSLFISSSLFISNTFSFYYDLSTSGGFTLV